MRKGWITRKAKLLSELGSDLGGILLIGINQVGAEGAVGLLPLKIFLFVLVVLGGLRPHRPSLLRGSPLAHGGSPFGVNLPPGGQ